MSLKVSDEVKKLARESGLDINVIVRLRETFPGSDMHKLLCAAVQSVIETERNRLETCELSAVESTRGEIKGLRRAIAIFNKQKD